MVEIRIAPTNFRTVLTFREIYRYFSSFYWGAPQGGGQAYVSCNLSLGKAGGGSDNKGTCGGCGYGIGRHNPETDTDWSGCRCVGCGRGGRVTH